MRQNKSYIIRLLEASTVDETYKIRRELEEKLITGFSPDEVQDFISELVEIVYDYKQLRKDSEVLSRFAELIAEYIPGRYFEKTL